MNKAVDVFLPPLQNEKKLSVCHCHTPSKIRDATNIMPYPSFAFNNGNIPSDLLLCKICVYNKL